MVSSTSFAVTGLLLPPILLDCGIGSVVSYVAWSIMAGKGVASCIRNPAPGAKVRTFIDITSFPLILTNTAITLAIMSLKIKQFIIDVINPLIPTLIHVSIVLQVVLYAVELLKKGVDIVYQYNFLKKSSYAFSQYLHIDEHEGNIEKLSVLQGKLLTEVAEGRAAERTVASIQLINQMDLSSDLSETINKVKMNICLDGLDFLKNSDEAPSLQSRVTAWAYGECTRDLDGLIARLKQGDQTAIGEAFTLFENIDEEAKKVMIIHVIAFIGIAIALMGACLALGGMPFAVPLTLYIIGWGLYVLSNVIYFGCDNQKGWDFRPVERLPFWMQNIYHYVRRKSSDAGQMWYDARPEVAS